MPPKDLREEKGLPGHSRGLTTTPGKGLAAGCRPNDTKPPMTSIDPGSKHVHGYQPRDDIKDAFTQAMTKATLESDDQPAHRRPPPGRVDRGPPLRTEESSRTPADPFPTTTNARVAPRRRSRRSRTDRARPDSPALPSYKAVYEDHPLF
ncbi:hypothetical protein [Streptomyces sp. NPDC059491]|uniref:hypothetical protein n=1 Tax=Streptomyces sp. NPDC059491 TaxID=3346850 RepID=UPI0036A591F8